MRSTLKFKVIELKMKAGLSLYAHTASKKLEAKAKREKKWINRTSNAVNSIQGSFEWRGSNVAIGLSGSTDYFPKLELGYEKRYSIITPTTQAMTREILSGFAKVVGS